MYKKFYNMTKDPFRNTPKPNLFFASNIHEAAWRFLISGIKDREQYLLITGDYGVGKTLLCLRLIKIMNQEGNILPHVFISTPNLRYLDILKKIAYFFGVEIPAENESMLQYDIMNYFEQQDSVYPLFIITDDAHDLETQTLDKLRILTNYSCKGIFPFRLILFAHTSFYNKLKSSSLRPLEQRIKRHYQISTFNQNETKEYIYFRLLNSGAKGVPYFEDSALQLIYEISQGVPRLINNLCDACLLIGAGDEALEIDTRIVRKAESFLYVDQQVQNNQDLERGNNQKQKNNDYPFSTQESSISQQKDHVTGSKDESPSQSINDEQLDFTNIRASQDRNKAEKTSGKEGSKVRAASASLFTGSKRTQILIITIVLIGLFILGFFWHLRDGFSFDPLVNNRYPTKFKKEMAVVNSSEQLQKQSVASNITNLSKHHNQTKPIQIVPNLSKKIKNQIDQDQIIPEKKDDKNQNTIPVTLDLLLLLQANKQKNNSGQLAKKSVKPTKLNRTDQLVAPVKQNSPFSLIISSCRQKNSAINVLKEINSNQGAFSAFLDQKKSPDGDSWWVVYFGAFTSEQEAEEAKIEIDRTQAMVKRVPYTNQIRVFDQFQMVEKFCHQLQEKGLWPHLIQKEGKFRVCLGQAVYKSKALSMKKVLAAKGYDSVVIKK